MSAGRRFKFAGSTISVLTGFTGNSPSIAITGISKTNPAVVTYSGGDFLTDGDVVDISGIVGMVEVDGAYVIDNVSTGANTFELVGVDATGYTTWSSGGLIDLGVFSNFCELTAYDRTGGTSPEIPATTVCSVATEYEIGLPDFGTSKLSFNFAPGTSVQGALHAFYLSGEKLAVKIVLPNSGGTMVQMGFVQQESEKASVGGLWTADTTIRNTGNRFDF